MENLLKKYPVAAYKIVCEMTIAISEILRKMNDNFMNMVNYVWA